MIALLLYLYAAGLTPAPAARRCEEHGPRLDGTYVTICDGSVAQVRDRLGNVRQWESPGGTVIVRSPGARPLVVAR
jgi:hypothetical protein